MPTEKLKLHLHHNLIEIISHHILLCYLFCKKDAQTNDLQPLSC